MSTRRDHSNDVVHAMRSRADATPTGLWARVRGRFPESLRAEVDAIADACQPSLLDLYHLESAVQLMLLDQLAQTTGAHSTERLHSVALQSRKNMRQIVSEMGPGVSADRQLVPVPEWLTGGLFRAEATLTVLLEKAGPTMADDDRRLLEQALEMSRPPGGDTGDELM